MISVEENRGIGGNLLASFVSDNGGRHRITKYSLGRGGPYMRQVQISRHTSGQ